MKRGPYKRYLTENVQIPRQTVKRLDFRNENEGTNQREIIQHQNESELNLAQLDDNNAPVSDVSMQY